jgi:hypothetical protein
MNISYLSPMSLILVAIIPSPEDLQLARILGWYRIPLRSAPRILNVDYIAFYQPATFRGRKWQIEYLAPVLGHELTTRIELLQDQVDHPRAEEEYFKIQIGTIQKLSQPISAGDWKRFTFLYTTGEYFQVAKILTDLTVCPSERSALWKTLRDRASSQVNYIEEWNFPEDLPLDLLSSLLGITSDRFEVSEGH